MRKRVLISRFLWVWAKRQYTIKRNTLNFVFSRKKKKNKTAGKNTRVKSLMSAALQIFMVILYLTLAFNMCWQTMLKLNKIIPSENIQTGTLEMPRFISYFAYTELERIDENARADQSTLSLKEKRSKLLYEPQKMSTYYSENGQQKEVKFKNYYEKISHELQHDLLKEDIVNKDEAELLINHFISNGMTTFTRDRNQFHVDFSGYQTEEFLKWAGFYFLLALLGLTFLEGIGNKNPLMQAPEDDLECLALLPIKIGVLFLLPLINRACFNVISILCSFPPAVISFMVLGHSVIESIFLALPITFMFCLCLASLQICYQYLGRYCSKKWIRTVCAYWQLPGLAAFLLMLLVIQNAYMLEKVRPYVLEDYGKLFPPSLFLSSIVKGHYDLIAVSVLITFLFPVVAIAFIVFFSQGGLPSIPKESGVRNKKIKAKPWTHSALRLMRDRSYLLQALVSPVILFIFYMLMYMNQETEVKGGMALSMLFGVVSFITLGSLINLAAHEGPSLWMVYCGSRPIYESLKKSILFWVKLCSVYYIIGVAIIYGAKVDEVSVIKMVALLVGIPSICFIAASFSFSAYSAYTGEPTPQKPKVSIIYLYMFFTSTFVQAVLFGMPGAQYTTPVLFGLLAFSIWQDCKRRLEYYLDPECDAETELTVKNAMLWCMCFFLLQSVLYLILFLSLESYSIMIVTMSYGGSALLTVLLASIWYRKKVMHSVPEPSQGTMSIGRGVTFVGIVGLLLIGFAWFYVSMLHTYFPELKNTFGWTDKIAFFILAVLFAPLLEEYLFRRLLQVSLLRTLNARTALLFGALVFAAIHPIASFPPVFCLGLSCAWLYWRTGNIWLAIVLHAFYNAGVVYFS